MYVHALHTVHALPDLRVAGGRLRDGVSRLFQVVQLPQFPQLAQFTQWPIEARF